MEPQVRDRLKDLVADIAGSTREVKEAKEALHDAKAALDAAYENLREYALELTDPEKTPLFDQVDRQTGEILTPDPATHTEEPR